MSLWFTQISSILAPIWIDFGTGASFLGIRFGGGLRIWEAHTSESWSHPCPKSRYAPYGEALFSGVLIFFRRNVTFGRNLFLRFCRACRGAYFDFLAQDVGRIVEPQSSKNWILKFKMVFSTRKRPNGASVASFSNGPRAHLGGSYLSEFVISDWMRRNRGFKVGSC